MEISSIFNTENDVSVMCIVMTALLQKNCMYYELIVNKLSDAIRLYKLNCSDSFIKHELCLQLGMGEGNRLKTGQLMVESFSANFLAMS